MLKVTNAAWNRLSKLVATRPGVSDLRVIYKDGKVRCAKGVRKLHDHVIEQAGRPKLLLTPAVATELSEQTLHAPKTERGRRLCLE